MENERQNDPAFEAVEEAGGGESEGFEQAEADLVENAEHGQRYASASSGDSALEAEEDPGSEFGEADHAESQE
ncbi:MAG: hypothetical protein H0T15_06665 [Thermoleophilaceae bacterium]|nr:hypothetical protein [Thermoleophilaceae bacterium]